MNEKLKIGLAAIVAVACIWLIVHQATREQGVTGTEQPQKPVKRNGIVETRSDSDTTITVRRRPRATPPHIVLPTVQPAATATPESAELRAIEERARAALATVGLDDNAETAWLAAINNRNIPAETRAELIDALTEEGFSDPDEYTEDDLPLIAARLDLIERIDAQAIDETNANAFNRVHETLVNLTEQLMSDSQDSMQ